MASTEYVILRWVAGETWEMDSRTWETSSSDQAVRKAAAQSGDSEGLLVAVPKRSWQPVEVRTEVKRQLRLSAPATKEEAKVTAVA